MERVAVVETIVQLVAQNDRQFLEHVLTDTLCELLPRIGVRLVRIEREGGECVVTLLSRSGEPDDLDIPTDACRCLAEACEPSADGACEMVPVPKGLPFTAAIAVPVADEAGRTFVLISGRVLSKADRKLASGVATIFKNYVNLLGASQTDGLTRLFNRKTFDEKLDSVIAEAANHHAGRPEERRTVHGEGTWLAVADIDHFKAVNDSFGHVFGDEVLLIFSQLMRQTFRREDLLFRYGGEEFAIVLTQTDLAGAWAVLERFRETVAARLIPQVGHVTCSIGFTRVGANEVPTALFGRADQALYYAKQNGRDQVRWHEDLVERGLLTRPGQAAEIELFA
ncbi:MAG TPA: GGDEF domain-containing protein [Candidatus Omnitrophota bacterium]|nr:GGDEF domain-containing protein [Candidatus Omnitrophota bacterium]